ncbi:hypothetical protein GIB67_018033 [Kingdonia uniflora]|uniref:C2H2-type domain-containing protein n=1 Tax=Kingdonia uniflora TaxID=39325 RepID=A0A7J7NWH1_9MAGN|nr:hypothetical protein GIB67_018033 [Kingdonia uniflora]
MEVVEEEHVQQVLIKGKRTKRHRPLSELPPLTLTMSSSSSGGASDDVYTTSLELEFARESTEEEEDMANCLILLAQGYNRSVLQTGSKRYRDVTEKAVVGASAGAEGFYVYECKTCNKCFSSFQALGGHRASHKKPRLAEEKKAMMMLFDQHQHHDQESSVLNSNITSSSSLNLQIGNHNHNNNNKVSKIHECSICGSEFASGQALGGHMRRHRSTTTTVSTTTPAESTRIMPDTQPTPPKKMRTVFSLDLNLPAPEDDRDSKLSFVTKQQSLLFSSAHALVDCHY